MITVSSLSLSSIKPNRLDEIRTATMRDETMIKLKATIMEGWLEDRGLLPSLTPYFTYRDELTAQDGVILRAERVVIPASQRNQNEGARWTFWRKLMSATTRQLIFWPGMSSDIRQYVETCDTCASSSDKQIIEPLHMHEIPHRPWEKVGTYFFVIEGRNYLVTVDYFSKLFEMYYLPESTSEAGTTKLKQHFARHGIPDKVISDNGPQYSSQHVCERMGFYPRNFTSSE